MIFKHKLIVAALLAFGVASGASAATSTLTGKTFSLNYDSAALGLYGTPLLSGDGLGINFMPTSFFAASSGAPSLVTSTLVMELVANAGYALNSINLTERGWSMGAFTAGGAQIILSANGLEDAASFNIPLNTSGTYSPWSASASVGIAGAERAFLSLNTTLLAAGPGAAIGLQQGGLNFDVASSVAAVPEPESYLMLLTGLGLVGAIARRRSVARG